MYVYVWQEVAECSGHYHASGGVVVFAKSQARARALANNEAGCNIGVNEEPDTTRKLAGEGKEAVYIMPDAGCC